VEVLGCMSEQAVQELYQVAVLYIFLSLEYVHEREQVAHTALLQCGWHPQVPYIQQY
jgi:hypothetical protein